MFLFLLTVPSSPSSFAPIFHPPPSKDECQCTCAGSDNLDTFDWRNIEPCMYASATPELIFTNLATEEFRKDLVSTFCTTGVKEGEMLESASPADPLFWMIHPVSLSNYMRLHEIAVRQFALFLSHSFLTLFPSSYLIFPTLSLSFVYTKRRSTA